MNKIKEYIKKAIKKGYNKETIKELLKSEEWREEEIEKVFSSLKSEKVEIKESLFLFLYLMGIWVLSFIILPLFYFFISDSINIKEVNYLQEYFLYLQELITPTMTVFFIAHAYIYAVLFIITHRHLSNKKSILFIFGSAIFYYILFLFVIINFLTGDGESKALYGFFLMIFGLPFLIVNLFIGILLGKIIYKFYLKYQNFTKKRKIIILIAIPLFIIFISLFLSYYNYTSLKNKRDIQEYVKSATDIESCRILKGENKNKCFYNIALLNKDINICNYLLSEDIFNKKEYSTSKYNCLYNIALMKEDFTICEYFPKIERDEEILHISHISIHGSKDSCYYNLSVNLKNDTGCFYIKNLEDKATCFMATNSRELTVSLCDQFSIKDKNKLASRFRCFYNIALMKEDFTICENLPPADESINFQDTNENCYYELSKKLKDDTGCFLITNNIHKKVSCLLYISPEKITTPICHDHKAYEIKTGKYYSPKSDECYKTVEKIKESNF